MNILIDENMPRSLAPKILELGINAQDVRDIGLGGQPDTEVMNAAIAGDAIIITRDRGLADPRSWPEEFAAGVVFVNLPSNTPVSTINSRILELLSNRLPESLVGAITSVEASRALSRQIRRR